jgi:NAD(P)-dependent dehydrogenase (short-subunit alcohol dehydrogenase family)
MQTLKDQRVIVTGGSAGLGLGVVEALVERKAKVMVLARDPQRLAEVERRLGVTVVAGDITDRGLAASLLRELRPTVVVLNAGAAPEPRPLHEQTWETFSACWNSDVQGGFVWLQEILRLPLERGSRVLVSSSGAAVNGSPLSGGYAGSKRMLWLLAKYANTVSDEQNLGIKVQALVPLQMNGATSLGRHAAEAYARRKGVTVEQFLQSFGKPLPPRQYGEHVAGILTEAQYEPVLAFGLKGDTGITTLEA